MRKLRQRFFNLYWVSEDFSDSSQKFQASWPFIPQSYLSLVMIFQNTNFSLLLPLLNPGYFSLWWRWWMPNRWKLHAHPSPGGTLRSQLPQSFHTAHCAFPTFAFWATVLQVAGCALFLCSELFCRLEWNSFTQEVQHVGPILHFIFYLKSWQ